MKNNKGFTLVEILAVLVLISLMMVIIVPNVQKVALNSKIKLCKSKINLAEESINLWARDNYKCFEKNDGCNILSNCQTNNDTIKCESTFKTLAENNLLNYDKNIKNTNYVINPINNGNMNDTKIFIEFNKQTKQTKSYLDKSIEDKICSKNASKVNTTIIENKTESNDDKITSTNNTKYTLTINNPDKHFINNMNLSSYKSGENISIPLIFETGYELDNYTCQNCECEKNDTILKVTIKNSNASVTIISKKKLICGSLSTDSWETIKENILNNNAGCYHIGDTKKISIENLPNSKKEDLLWTIRLSNNTSPAECNNSSFSETACGYVFEFEDVISSSWMNSNSTSSGGYPKSFLYNIINTELYDLLPTDLKSVLKTVKVVSSHSKNDANDFITYDKIYLLSLREIYGNNSASYVINNDTAWNKTRQLDYYKQGNSSIKSDAFSENYPWWLRTAIPSDGFAAVETNGNPEFYSSTFDLGISIAFKIA